MKEVRFRAFRAVDEPAACERFIVGHQRVLEIYDIKMITSNKSLWVEHPGTYVILVEDVDDNKVLGGARIQIADNLLPLPIVDAVKIVDERILHIINQHQLTGLTGEICGLWNSREIAGYGIGSIYLGWAGVALARILGIQSLFALCAPATVRPSKQVGFTIERGLGSNGYFNYPKLNLVATAMIIHDVPVLSSAIDLVRQTVSGLFVNPQQTITFDSPKGDVTIHYDLRIPNGAA